MFRNAVFTILSSLLFWQPVAFAKRTVFTVSMDVPGSGWSTGLYGIFCNLVSLASSGNQTVTVTGFFDGTMSYNTGGPTTVTIGPATPPQTVLVNASSIGPNQSVYWAWGYAVANAGTLPKSFTIDVTESKGAVAAKCMWCVNGNMCGPIPVNAGRPF